MNETAKMGGHKVGLGGKWVVKVVTKKKMGRRSWFDATTAVTIGL